MVRILAGCTTGTMAILSAQPTDVVKVRMQAEVKLPGERSRYNGVFHAYSTIAREEGLKGLYKGKSYSYAIFSGCVAKMRVLWNEQIACTSFICFLIHGNIIYLFQGFIE